MRYLTEFCTNLVEGHNRGDKKVFFIQEAHTSKSQDDLPTDGPLPRADVALPVIQAKIWLQITNAIAWQPVDA